MLNKFKAFLTGSHAYGIPMPESDVDLVIMVNNATLGKLEALADFDSKWQKEDENYIAAGGTPLRFGRLNLICCTNEKMYEAWLEGTKLLKKQLPVSRPFAVEFMRRVRERFGFVQPSPDTMPSSRKRFSDDESNLPF